MAIASRLEFEMPLSLEPVDSKHPNLVALIHGPVTLFEVGLGSTGLSGAEIRRSELLGARPVSTASSAWEAVTSGGRMAFLPFEEIGDESYRLYHSVTS
jgi:hypothetical protein